MLLWIRRCIYLFKLRVSVFSGYIYIYIYIYTHRSGIAGSDGSSIFSLFKEPPQWLPKFALQNGVYLSTTAAKGVLWGQGADCRSRAWQAVIIKWQHGWLGERIKNTPGGGSPGKESTGNFFRWDNTERRPTPNWHLKYVLHKSIKLIRYLHLWLAPQMHETGTSLVVQRLRLHAPNANSLS